MLTNFRSAHRCLLEYTPTGHVIFRRRLHSQDGMARLVKSSIERCPFTTRVHEAENVRSPVHKETEMGEDRTEIAATRHLTMPEADWEQARLQQRVIARVVLQTPGEEPCSLLAVI